MTPSEQSYPEPSIKYAQLPTANGKYFVGSDGSIFRLLELKFGRNSKKKHSYYVVTLFDEDGRKHWATVHSIVAHCFLGPRPTGMFIDHIDGNTSNNDISNLEYVTPAENVRRAFASGRRKINHAALQKMADAARGRRSEKRKFTDEQAHEIITEYKSGQQSMKELAEKHGCSAACICLMVHGKKTYRELKRVNAPSVIARQKPFE